LFHICIIKHLYLQDSNRLCRSFTRIIGSSTTLQSRKSRNVKQGSRYAMNPVVFVHLVVGISHLHHRILSWHLSCGSTNIATTGLPKELVRALLLLSTACPVSMDSVVAGIQAFASG
jgi:hypothetical protein